MFSEDHNRYLLLQQNQRYFFIIVLCLVLLIIIICSRRSCLVEKKTFLILICLILPVTLFCATYMILFGIYEKLVYPKSTLNGFNTKGGYYIYYSPFSDFTYVYLNFRSDNTKRTQSYIVQQFEIISKSI